MPALNWNDGLALTAEEVCLDASRIRASGRTVVELSKMYGTATKPVDSVRSYGVSGAKDAALNLYIDDGLDSRPNQATILHPSVGVIGVANCQHETTEAKIVVAVFASEFLISTAGKRRIAIEGNLRKSLGGGRRLKGETVKKSSFNKKDLMKSLNAKTLATAAVAMGLTALLAL